MLNYFSVDQSSGPTDQQIDMAWFKKVLITHLSIIHQLQYDYGGWMPNTPISLQLPPPTTKGTTSEATMLQTFPDINTTVQGMATLWLLSKDSSDFVSAKYFIKNYRN